MQIRFFGDKEFFKLPLKSNFEKDIEKGKLGAMFSVMQHTEDKLEVTAAEQGVAKITEFSDAKVVFEIEAQGSSETAEIKERNLVPMKGTITIMYPVIIYTDVKKEEIF